MNPFTQAAFAVCASFTAYMVWAAFRVKKAIKRQSSSGRAVHLIMLFSSFFMCFAPFPHWGMLDSRIIPSTFLFGWLGVGVCAVGFAFCFWARRTLGGNWSGAVTLKEGHELIQKGPYALSRHPMYTGILTGLLEWP